MKKAGKSLADQLFPIEKSDDEISVLNIPPEKRRLHTETYDFSISTLISHLNEKAIVVPEFQRNYVWNRGQASRLIESLIIQCPIPVIYLNQERDETLSVIDGNQRLTSIKLFLEDGFELQGLTAYPELEGSRFSDLDPRFRRHIQNRTLRCITILKETHPQIKFDVFERINTGAVQLNPQEVRHGVYHGPLMKFIDELSAEKVWKSISGHRNDTRMKGGELVLRYLALNNRQESYRKPLKGFLNQFCDEFSNLDEEIKLRWKKEFLTAVESVNYIFGDKSFKILSDDLRPTVKNVNSALFDAVMVGFTRVEITIRELEKIDKEDFLRKFQQFISEVEFKRAITSGTSASSSVNYRINSMLKFLERELK
ncbi:DUF262 domain-containing protein [Thalassolituus sp.]|uniref:DUF262 domain-containing protein n=1 Tax=Thalassolituus sp. TaxID=2030822 RepID=UPI002601E721|nr:DUF262 domain-containing protein [Thalassolituus sp.]